MINIAGRCAPGADLGPRPTSGPSLVCSGLHVTATPSLTSGLARRVAPMGAFVALRSKLGATRLWGPLTPPPGVPSLEMEAANVNVDVPASAGMLANGMLAGIFICSCLIEHAERRLSASHWLAYKQNKEALFGPIMPTIFGGVLSLSLGLAIFSRQHVIFGAAVGFLVIALAITAVVHLPLNRRFQHWSSEEIPADWDDARRRWREWNWLRAAPVVAAAVVSLGAS